MNKYPEYANKDDRLCAAALIQAILDSDEKATVTIDIGEEDAEIEESRNKLDILKAMSATGDEYVVVRKEGEQLGYFWVIYDNGSDGDPMILISDYVANDYCDKIYNVVDGKMEKYTD